MKLLLAGGEAWWDTFARYGIRYILFSYHYLRTQRDFRAMTQWMREAKIKGHKDGPYFFMLDSGAYTFQVNKRPEELIGPLDKYADEFINFLETDECVDLFDTIAELDVYAATPEKQGWERVHEWRDRMYAAVGPRLMPVLHDFHEESYWNELCKIKELPWLGISSNIGTKSETGTVSRMQKLIGKAHRTGHQVHAFGMTRIQTDMKYLRNLDTADSTTWLRADKFGGTFIYNRGHMQILSHLQKADRAFHKAYFKRIGLDPKRILGTHMDHASHCEGPNKQTPECDACRDQLHELRASSLIAWRNMAIHYDREGVGPFSNWRPQ